MLFQLSRGFTQSVAFGCLFYFLVVSQPAMSLGQDEGGQQFVLGETPPVRRIVFFNSGIAQVLHQGKITGNQLVEISFDRNEVDDVLKSIVFDNESGSVESVQYQPAPGKELLAAERLGPPMTLAQTLQNYRGEQVTLRIDDESANGSILGVETRTQGDTSYDILTLVSPSGLKTYDLTDLDTIQFDSKKIQDELRLGMLGLSNDRDVQKKSLSLFFEGKQERKVQFGYVVDAPIWRMTYRLDLGAKKSTLQGWAHVDNVTGFDWENVFVDLRSGRPQAFNVELFSPLVAERPARGRSVFGIPPELIVSSSFGLAGRLAESWNDTGQSGNSSRLRYRGFGGGGFGGGMGGGGFGGGGGGNFGGGGGGGTFGSSNEGAEVREEMDIDDGFEVAAGQGRASRMLQFEIEKPINLASGRSAMLPILSQEVKTELQTFFDLTRTKKPAGQLIVKMTNGKTFSIIAGPATIYQQGNFIGDAALDRTDVGESTKLAYGQDQPVTLEFTTGTATRINKLIRLSKTTTKPNLIVEGVSRQKHKLVIDNKDVTKRNVRIRLPIGKAEATPKPVENTDGVAEFEFEVAANRIRSEAITLDTKVEESWPLSRVLVTVHAGWKKSDVRIEPEVEQLLTRYFEANTALSKANDGVSELNKRIRESQTEQDRLTKIIQAVKSETSAAPFVEKLTKHDNEMETLRSLLGDAEAELKSARERLEKITDGP